MPLLQRRNAARLLQTVNGKPHATKDDHAEPLPTPPSTNSARSSVAGFSTMEREDINRSPESSEDEGYSGSKPAAGFRLVRQLDGADDEKPKLRQFKEPLSFIPATSDNQRGQFVDPRNGDNDSVLFEQANHKRRKTSSFTNIHARPRGKKTYDRRQRNSWQHTSQSAALNALRQQPATAQTPGPAKVEFKVAKGLDVFEFGERAVEPQFRVARGLGDIDDQDTENLNSSSVSPLSSARSSPEPEEKRKLGLPEPTPTRIECAICGEQVQAFLKEEFENNFTNGQSILNYKWQQRFCRWHGKQDAKRKQLERGYPEVDWERLESRMRRHHAHLQNVMDGAKQSYYRDQLSERVKERSKTAMQVYNAGVKRGASVGYYGPRGERVMTDHVINHLSAKLREQSSKDKLVAAVGISGGVSGFVQTVLVPELAEQLIMEDMKVSSERARAIITESAELGELLHPDVDDKVTAES